MIYENVELTGSLDISGSFQAPYGVSGSEPTSPSSGSLFFNTTDEKLYVWEGSWEIVGTQVQPPAIADIEYLVVAGGGGGGAAGAGAGGGGAGGLLSSSLSQIESGSSITVTVGSGGSKGSGTLYGNGGSDGGDSSIASAGGTSFTTVTSTGGGGGSAGASGVNGRDGGSGGGGNGGYNTDGGNGITGQGNDGGDSAFYSNGSGTDHYAGGGGGGASVVGGDATAASNVETGGNGGDGKQSSITGTSTYYAGGGGGGAGYRSSSPTGGTAGQGGGTAGSSGKVGNASDATINTGGGGGGGGGFATTDPNGGSARDGGTGGSGVVILAYPSSSINAVGGIVGDAGNGRKYHQFNESGTLKVGSTSDFGIVTSSLNLHLDAGNFASRGTSTWTDLTGNGYNGTATNGASLSNGPYYTLDGTNDTIRFTENSNMINTSTMSIEMWVAVGSIGANFVQFLTNRSSTAGDYSTTMALGIDNRRVVRTWNPSGTDYMVAYVHVGNNAGNNNTYAFKKDLFGTTNGDGNFHHVVGTFNSGTLNFYYDGVLQNTQSTFTSIWAGDEYYRIGGEYSPGDYTYNLTGDVGQMRFYHKALSAAEVLQNYNATKTNFV